MEFDFKKKFGQNFLQDKNVLQNIVKGTEIDENSLVIEIGPGSGNLTREIAKVAKQVLCYEIDKELEPILDENLAEYKNVDIIFDDFMKRDPLFDIKKYGYSNIYVCANLPYYITTPIIEKLIECGINFKAITIMIQKEVGERFSAKPNTRDYASITVFLNYYFNIKKLFVVSRNAFIPKPNVDSIVIKLSSRENKEELKNKDLFFKLIRDSFKFKRKNLRNNLKGYDQKKIEEVLKKYKLDLGARAEQLDLNIFVDIANSL